MSATTLVETLVSRGVELAVEGDRLKVRAPRGTLSAADLEALAGCKDEVLALVGGSAPKRDATPDLSARWGPGLTDPTPPITIPRDWSCRLAGWPHGQWAAWRARAGEVTTLARGLGFGAEPAVRVGDRAAYLDYASPDEYEPEVLALGALGRGPLAEFHRRCDTFQARGLDERLAEHLAFATVIEQLSSAEEES